ncbi:MAG: hypothetical protein KDD50_12335 [Bdellovibrionales bacterium]|nr:hypothetical protein [Bdellovibrionales bacterium]
MKLFNSFFAIAITLVSFSVFAAGGDVIGGGNLVDLEKELLLSPTDKTTLKQLQPTIAYKTWEDSLSPQEKNDMVKKIYKEFVLPQLKNKK